MTSTTTQPNYAQVAYGTRTHPVIIGLGGEPVHLLTREQATELVDMLQNVIESIGPSPLQPNDLRVLCNKLTTEVDRHPYGSRRRYLAEAQAVAHLDALYDLTALEISEGIGVDEHDIPEMLELQQRLDNLGREPLRAPRPTATT